VKDAPDFMQEAGNATKSEDPMDTFSQENT